MQNNHRPGEERKINLKRCLLLLSVVLMLVFVQVSVWAQASVGYLEYENEEYQFSVMYPEEWDGHEGVMGTVFLALSPPEGDGDEFQENFNVVLGDLGGFTFTADDYYQLSIAELERVVDDFAIIGGGDTLLAGHNAKLLIFSGSQEGMKLRWMQGFILHGGWAYVLTFTAEAEHFNSYLPQALAIFNAFTIR